MYEYQIAIFTSTYINNKEQLELEKIIDRYIKNIKINRKKCKGWKLKF